jgi:hypothetical protein
VLLTGQVNAIVFVTQNWNPGGSGGVYNNHTIGIYYEGSTHAVFNQDGVNMTNDADFNIWIPPIP